MPKVQQVVQGFFGKEPHKGVNPDEVVAVGAAIQGGVLKGEVKDVLLLDVTPLSLGVETAGAWPPRSSRRTPPFPARKAQVFSTAVDNQPIVNVHVLQGEREMSADNKTLARFRAGGHPAGAARVPQIEVAFDIDANGIVHVSAKTSAPASSRASASWRLSGLTEQEIQKMIADAEQAQIFRTRRRRKLADVKNSADGLIYTTEKALRSIRRCSRPRTWRRFAPTLEALKKVRRQRGSPPHQSGRPAAGRLRPIASRMPSTPRATPATRKAAAKS